MRNIYETRRNLKMAFIIISLCLAGTFLWISNSLMKALEAEERSKMEIWAEATRQLAGNDANTDMSLVLKVIQSNTTIPVVIMDENEMLLWHINFDVSQNDTLGFFQHKSSELRDKNNMIEVIISDDMSQYLYYDDSVLLKRLSYYPYVQLGILLLFILIAYFAFASTKKAEQNRVWVGLSKETAHQLGTPISSLMAWLDFMKATDISPEIVKEMNKDVVRLNTIADRFSKIGSEPQLEVQDLNTVIEDAVSYMRKRISSKTTIETSTLSHPAYARICLPLFDWVIENILKNAIDATTGEGKIKVTIAEVPDKIILEFEDNGKGILKKNFKTVFNPGYTTKKRGWGLGLTLVQRIIEEYHHGKIYVKESIPNTSTIFRIELKKSDSI